MWNVEWSLELSHTRNLYLTKTKHDIWYYQRWLPSYIHCNHPQCKRLFRISLRTKNKQIAIQLSRVLSVEFDGLLQNHAGSPDLFFNTLKILSTNIIKGTSHSVVHTSGGSIHHEVNGYHEAILAEIRRFREENEKLISTLSKLIDSASVKFDQKQSVKIPNTVNTIVSGDDNPTMSKLLVGWIAESTMRTSSLESTYKPAIRL